MYKPTTIEQKNVLDVYDSISDEFNNTRRSVWDAVKQFLDSLPSDSTGFEIGCGNGKNMLYRKDLIMEGIDTCPSLVDMCKSKGLNVKQGNILDKVDRFEFYDFAISIAVFHHLSTEDNRMLALLSMINMIKRGGKGLLSVWSVEQESYSKKEFKLGNNMVKWHRRKILADGSQGYDTFDRYYYVYDESAFLDFTTLFISYINVETIFYEKGNWFCIFTKK